ncbi:MAG: hypothetical protein LBG81_06115, partial [Coriobacteriaceae bacterium]|nr:hypothetical protein [Coriobacteriaceae bacterium]
MDRRSFLGLGALAAGGIASGSLIAGGLTGCAPNARAEGGTESDKAGKTQAAEDWFGKAADLASFEFVAELETEVLV